MNTVFFQFDNAKVGETAVAKNANILYRLSKINDFI